MNKALLVALVGALAVGQAGCGSAPGVLPSANARSAANISRALPAAAPTDPPILITTSNISRALPAAGPTSTPVPVVDGMSGAGHGSLVPSSGRALPGFGPTGDPTPPPADDTLRAVPI